MIVFIFYLIPLLLCIDCFYIIAKSRIVDRGDHILVYEALVASTVTLLPVVNIICSVGYIASFFNENFIETIYYNKEKYSLFKFLFKQVV